MSPTSVDANSQLSRTITSGRHSCTMRRSPGSACSVSRRPKYSVSIARFASSNDASIIAAIRGRQTSGGAAGTGVEGRPSLRALG